MTLGPRMALSMGHLLRLKIAWRSWSFRFLPRLHFNKLSQSENFGILCNYSVSGEFIYFPMDQSLLDHVITKSPPKRRLCPAMTANSHQSTRWYPFCYGYWWDSPVIFYRFSLWFSSTFLIPDISLGNSRTLLVMEAATLIREWPPLETWVLGMEH